MLVLVLIAVLLQPVFGQRCLSSEAYFISDGRDYRGSVNVSASGAACLHWSEQHDLQVPNPSLGLLPGDNSCRNPFGLAAPFCFTSSGGVPYQLCNVGPPCPYVQPQPYLMFVPSSPSIPAGTFVSIACFPQPCQIYFTLDGTVPMVGVSPSFQHAFAVTSSTTVSAVGVLLSGASLTASQLFTVIVPPPLPAVFFPDPMTVFYAPVFVTLRGFPSGFSVEIFVNGSGTGFSYTGPFWLASSASVVAVFNRSQTLVAAYTILSPTPMPPNIFPSSGGVFIGGVKVLVYRPQAVQLLEASINGSAWLPLPEPAYLISSAGFTTFAVRATFLGGLVSATSLGNYTVFPALPPVCVPSSAAVYTTPTNVSCSDPAGKPLKLTLNGMLLPQSTWLLNLPGTYSIGASYTDDGGFDRSVVLQYVLAAVPLPTPSIFPCAGMFLGPLIVTVAVGSPATSNWQLVTSLNGSGPVFRASISGPITAMLKSFDPMFLDSDVASCSLGISTTGGAASSPTLRVRNAMPTMLADVGRCLLLAAPELYIRIGLPVGPYVLVNIVNVSDWFAAMYDSKLEQCLAAAQPQAAARIYSLVTGYTPLLDSVLVGSVAQVQIIGSGLTTATYRVVRAEYDCNDIGAPLGTCSDKMVCSASLSFVGLYAICANCGDGFYKVPGGTFLNFTSSVATMKAPTVMPCGGPVSRAVLVALDSSPGVMYSINGSVWAVAPPSLLVAAPSILTVRSAAGVQTACSFFTASADTLFSAYSLVFPASGGLRIGLQGSAALDAAVAVQVARSATCNDTMPLFAVYVTMGTSGWIADGALSLPSPSRDVTSLYVCVLGQPMAPTNVMLSPLALSTVPCAASATGCYRDVPTCVAGDMRLSLCGPAATAPPTDYTFMLKWLLLAAYVVAVVIIFLNWRSSSSKEHIPGSPKLSTV